jgi:amino acid permease
MEYLWIKERLNYIIALLSAILVVFFAYAYPAETFLGVIVLISPGIPIMLVVFIIYKLYNQKRRTST